ncbi:MAG: DsbC family protein [Xanthomonadales bacterium]|nr:DsbC family protein [Xanthomonadales bacterium]MCB1635072.1 DsbC family protein [Xanthomonadales bacterium]
MDKRWIHATMALLALAGSAAWADKEKATAAIKTLVPDVSVDQVQSAPLPGFQEVIVNGNIIYVSDDGKYLMQGMLYDIENRRDLTEARKAGIRETAMAAAPVAERIIFPAKNKKHTVAVFTDIDCGFCRRLHQEIETYTEQGIEIQYLLFPRAGTGSDSFRKAVAVWCDKDQKNALTHAKNGEDPGNATCTNPIEAQFQLGQRVGVTGTPTLIFEDGSIQPGYLTAEQMLQRLERVEANVAAR